MSTPERFLVDGARALRDFQDNVPDAGPAFLSLFGRYIENLAKRRCDAHRLLRQDVEEVTQETLRLLFDPNVVRYKDVNCSAKCYIGGQVFNAARIVASAYRNGPSRRKTAVHVELEAEELRPIDRGVADAEFRLLLHDITKNADDVSRTIISAVHEDGATVVDVAARLHLTRFQVHRRLNAMYAIARLLLAA